MRLGMQGLTDEEAFQWRKKTRWEGFMEWLAKRICLDEVHSFGKGILSTFWNWKNRDSDILLVGTNWPHHLGSSHSTFTYIYIYTYIHCEIPYFVYFEWKMSTISIYFPFASEFMYTGGQFGGALHRARSSCRTTPGRGFRNSGVFLCYPTYPPRN